MATETKEKEVPEVGQKATGTADDFFKTESNEDINSWVKHMKAPREKIDEPDVEFPDDEPAPGSAGGESDDQVLSYFDYTEGQYKTAEFFLIQLDKLMAFSFSLISGMETDRYRLRKVKPQGNDYEAEITAALIKKYQMELPLEWMLATALVMAYAPGLKQAFSDRAKAQEARAAAQESK